MVDQAVYIVNATTIFTRKISHKFLRLTDSLSCAIALDISNQLIYSLQSLLILLLPVQIIRPGII